MADHVTKFKHPEDPQLGFLIIVAVEAVKWKKEEDLTVRENYWMCNLGTIFKGMNTRKDSTQTALQGKREREWFTEKGHGVMNILKQLSINVKLQVQHLSRPDSIEYCKSLL